MTAREGREFYAEAYGHSSGTVFLYGSGVEQKHNIAETSGTTAGSGKNGSSHTGRNYLSQGNAAGSPASDIRKTAPPFSEFLREVSRQASLFQGDCFSKIFRETAQQCLKDSALHKKDLEAFSQLGEYLGWMDITLQKNTITLYQEQLKQEIQYLERELPGRKKMCQSLGVIAGIFLSILCL